MHVEALPDELLVLIFKYVDVQDLYSGVPHVSRRWAGLARLLAAEARSEGEILALRRGLRALLVPAGLEGRSVQLLASAAQLAPRLASLTVHAGVRFNSVELGSLVRWLPHLLHLDVFPQPGTSVTPAPRSLRSLVINGPQDSFSGLDGSPLRALHMFGEAQYCSMRQLSLLTGLREQLTELTLRCAELDDRAYATIGRCSNLVVLQLYSCWLMRAGAAEVARLRRLRRLHVTGAVMLRSAGLRQMLDQLPRGLEELVLSGGQLGDEHLESLAALPRLEVLEAWHCLLTQQGVMRLAAACRRLRVLDLDLPLDVNQLVTLRGHPNLKFVRCQPSGMCAADEMWTMSSDGALRLEPAAAQFPGNYFRPNGDGFRGKLYYYWTRPLQLFPRRAPAQPYGSQRCDLNCDQIGTDFLPKKRRRETIL